MQREILLLAMQSSLICIGNVNQTPHALPLFSRFCTSFAKDVKALGVLSADVRSELQFELCQPYLMRNLAVVVLSSSDTRIPRNGKTLSSRGFRSFLCLRVVQFQRTAHLVYFPSHVSMFALPLFKGDTEQAALSSKSQNTILLVGGPRGTASWLQASRQGSEGMDWQPFLS